MTRGLAIFRAGRSFLSGNELDHFRRNRRALDGLRILRGPAGPDPNLSALHGQRFLVEEPMANEKATAADFRELALDHYLVAETRGRAERGLHIYQRDPDDAVLLQHRRFRQSGLFEKGRCACIEIFKIARKIDDLRGIAIAPFNWNDFSIFQGLSGTAVSR